MGAKADPRGQRVGIMQKWASEWYVTSQAQAAAYFVEDMRVRALVETTYARAGISKVIVRKSDTVGEVLIFTAKPAAIIWKDGAELTKFEARLKKLTGATYKVTVKEVKVPELSAKIMSEFAAIQLESRTPHRRVAKGIMQKVMEKGALGVKIKIGGRLGGTDISRSEHFSEGRIPLQTLRSDVDYHHTTALTKYGILGIKVWICKSENITISKKQNALDKISV
jgi:small subunit ribosomal protein S3